MGDLLSKSRLARSYAKCMYSCLSEQSLRPGRFDDQRSECMPAKVSRCGIVFRRNQLVKWWKIELLSQGETNTKSQKHSTQEESSAIDDDGHLCFIWPGAVSPAWQYGVGRPLVQRFCSGARLWKNKLHSHMTPHRNYSQNDFRCPLTYSMPRPRPRPYPSDESRRSSLMRLQGCSCSRGRGSSSRGPGDPDEAPLHQSTQVQRRGGLPVLVLPRRKG